MTTPILSIPSSEIGHSRGVYRAARINLIFLCLLATFNSVSYAQQPPDCIDCGCIMPAMLGTTLTTSSTPCDDVITASFGASDFGRFYAYAGNRYTLSLCNFSGNTMAYITSNTTIPGIIACDDDGCGTPYGPSQISFIPLSDGMYRLYVFSETCGEIMNPSPTLDVYINCTPVGPPPNDLPCGAFELPINGGVCNFTMGDNTAATNSANSIGPIPVPNCPGALYQGADLWFTVQVPPTGHFGITTEEGTLCAGAFQFYITTNCGDGSAFTALTGGCSIEGDLPDSPPAIEFDALAHGLSPGSTVYIRYWERNGNENGSFEICAFEVSLDCDADFEIVQSLNGNILIPFTFHIVNNSTGEAPIGYSWNNIPSTDAEPTHVIQTNGEDHVFELCLTITDGLGCTTSHCDTVFVDTNGIIHQDLPVQCDASFSVEQTAPFTALLTNTSTAFALSGATWSFPNNQTSSGNTTSYTFNGPGIYEVCMTPNGYGCGTICQQITVTANGDITTQTCLAGFWVIQAFEYDNMGDPVPVPYHLWVWNISSGDDPMDNLWDFGDGNSSTEPFPMHIYASSGPYELCLTIQDGSGCTDTYCDSISVDNDGLLGMMLDGGGHRNALTINVLPNMPLGLQDLKAFDDITAWPNPASDLLNISLGRILTGRTTVTIIDLNGRIVRIMDSRLRTGTDRITIPITDLADGMYMIRIENGGNAMHSRFVKH